MACSKVSYSELPPIAPRTVSYPALDCTKYSGQSKVLYEKFQKFQELDFLILLDILVQYLQLSKTLRRKVRDSYYSTVYHLSSMLFWPWA